jgi:predicted CoA-substrate-specific enzyme activase
MTILGIDIGSSYTKGVLFNDEIKKRIVIKTAFKPKQVIEEIKLKLSGYDKIVATGFGRELVKDADKIITEITAFARGASYIEPSVRTVIDIGGQDSKIIKISNNKTDRFVMNDRCAAGTGNFIEKIARALNLTLKQFGNLAVISDRPETIDSLCVVMAETEILSLVGEGKNIEDIAAGVCDSLVRRISGIGSQIGIEEPILFCGGGALNPGLVKSMHRVLGNVIVANDAQFIGAIGAALSI